MEPMEALIKTQVVKIPQYAKMTGLSQTEVRRLCEQGLIPATRKGKGGHWYISVTAPDTVSRDDYNKVLLENRELKTKLKTILALCGGING